MPPPSLRIDGQRLWSSLMEMAQIGATARGGVCRLALTDEDKQARDLFVRWCREAGCEISIDQMGNIFARRAGSDSSRAPVMTGSHLDTQPTGGRFDGVLGVLAGLEVIRTLNDAQLATRAPVEVAVWTNEEGSRFAPAMVASGVFAGAFDLDYGLSRRDAEGRSLGDELARVGYAGERAASGHAVGAFFELHIEQGPVLEAAGKAIGVVTGAQGQRWYEASVNGREAHAGTTPMAARSDALLAAAEAVRAAHQIALRFAPACATVGLLTVAPNSRNTVPGNVFFSVDLRHPNEELLSEMDAALRLAFETIGVAHRVDISLRQIWHSPALRFDRSCQRAIRTAAERLGFSHHDIVSGAGHDACYLNRIAPTGMVFIPCAGGISHNEEEAATPEHVEQGAAVLLHAMLEFAQ